MKNTDDLTLISVSFNFRDESLYFLDNQINILSHLSFFLIFVLLNPQ